MEDESDTPACDGGEPLADPRSLPSAKSSPVYAEQYAVEHALSVSALVEQCQREIQEIYRLRRAILERLLRNANKLELTAQSPRTFA